jgi:hypothetical protein
MENTIRRRLNKDGKVEYQPGDSMVEEWMRVRGGDPHLSFDADDQDGKNAFEKNARERGFVISAKFEVRAENDNGDILIVASDQKDTAEALAGDFRRDGLKKVRVVENSN